MNDPILTQLGKRKTSQLSPLFFDLASLDKAALDSLFFLSSDDTGVWRNGGRRGARFAPEALLNQLKKFSIQAQHQNKKFGFFEVAKNETYDQNFSKAQEKSAKLMAQGLEKFLNGPLKNIFHLGGGHDHIYPLLKALEEKFHSPIGVINIDAHTDTRTDELPHSGTPFRQFARQSKRAFKLVQVGIHQFANPLENFNGEIKNVMFATSPHQYKRDIVELVESSPDEMIWVLSLDADALSSSIMEGVSAVNPDGLPPEQVKEIFKIYQEMTQKRGQKTAVYGIYEYNPVLDNLSQKGARFLSSLLYHLLS